MLTALSPGSWIAWLRAVTNVVCLVVLAGCSGQQIEAHKVYPVTGEVQVKGQPASGALVTLHPLSKSGKLLEQGHRAAGTASSDGRFVITSYEFGDGAEPGEYALTVIWPSPTPPGETTDRTGPDQLEGKYSKPESPLTKVTIVAGQNQLDPLQIE